MSRKRVLSIVLVILALTSACSLFNTVTGGGQSVKQVSDLWEDVPRMDGLVKANLQLPLPARLLVQTAMKSITDTGGSINIVSFTTQHTPADILDFYTTDKMSAAGWDSGEGTGCLGNAQDAASAGGAVCVFGKQVDPEHGSVLAVVVIEDSKNKASQVYFARFDYANQITPSPAG